MAFYKRLSIFQCPAGKGHEENTGDLLDKDIVRFFVDQDQVLIAERVPQGENQPAARFELTQKGRGDVIHCCGNHDTIKGRGRLVTEISVA